MMQTERRSAHRQGLNSLLYLDLEPDNGGILLNLSETGMQISVAKRLVTSTEVRFTLCLNPKEKISGTGRIAWLSPSGRSAGVHFLDLPESARRDIRQWMDQTADSLSSEQSQTLRAPRPELLPMEGAKPEPVPVVAPSEPPLLPETQAESTETAPPPFRRVEEPAPQPVASASVDEQPPEFAAPSVQPAEPTLPPPPAVETEASEPPQPVLEQASPVEIPPEAPRTEIRAAEPLAPVPQDPLELLVSAVEPLSLESAPSPWAPPSLPPIEALAAGNGDAQPSLLALYDIDISEKETVPCPEPLKPPQPPRETGAKTQSAAALERTRRRAEFRRMARAAARATIQPAPQTEPKPVILDGLTDVGSLPRPSAPADKEKEAVRRAQAIKLTSPIFIPAPPQFQLPPPEIPAVKTHAPVVPVFDPPAPEQPLPEPLPEQSSAASETTSLSQTHASETERAGGALYLPNYKVNGITPDGTTWRASRLLANPFVAVTEVSERFETFGWSLESDWHVWVALILLVAGFLALAQNPPLVVLTVAFWFAAAVVILERQRPRHGSRRPQKPGQH